MEKLKETIENLKKNGFRFIESCLNGEEVVYGFNEDKSLEVTIKINHSPDNDAIEEFEQHLRETDFSEVLEEERRAELIKNREEN